MLGQSHQALLDDLIRIRITEPETPREVGSEPQVRPKQALKRTLVPALKPGPPKGVICGPHTPIVPPVASMFQGSPTVERARVRREGWSALPHTDGRSRRNALDPDFSESV